MGRKWWPTLSLEKRTWHSTPTHWRTVSTMRALAIDFTGDMSLEVRPSSGTTAISEPNANISWVSFRWEIQPPQSRSGKFFLHSSWWFHRHSQFQHLLDFPRFDVKDGVQHLTDKAKFNPCR